MVKSSSTLPHVATDTWIQATWEEFLDLGDHPQYAKGKFYYDQGYMRIEMSPLGSAHGHDNAIVSTVVVVYAALKSAFRSLLILALEKQECGKLNLTPLSILGSISGFSLATTPRLTWIS